MGSAGTEIQEEEGQAGIQEDAKAGTEVQQA